MSNVILRFRRRWWRPARIAPFHRKHRERLCPLDQCVALQRKAHAALRLTDPLKPTKTVRKGTALADRELAARLGGEDFGEWSPEIEAVDWLVRWVSQLRPRRIVEFGSGRTTVCWCVILTRVHGPDGFRILSIDEDPENVDRTNSRLAGLPGRDSCRIVHAPLLPAVVGGHETFRYDIDVVDAKHFEWLGPADFVFVDGPYANGPCRYGTLPAVRSRVRPGAAFVLHNALRDKELLTATVWADDGLKIEGVLTVGQGLTIGRF